MYLVLSLLLAMNPTTSSEDSPKPTPPKELFKKFVGTWEGTCRTWFVPDKLADESPVKGDIQLMLGGRFLRHTYTGQMKGKPRTGEETIGFNSMKKKFQTSWVDDFHMRDGILISEGDATPTGFSVSGKYDAGGPPWGWKTVYELVDDDHLTITAYNITPAGKEAKAVETKYQRKK